MREQPERDTVRDRGLLTITEKPELRQLGPFKAHKTAVGDGDACASFRNPREQWSQTAPGQTPPLWVYT